MSDATVTAPDPAGLDQLIDAIANLEVPLRHDLALCCLLELRDARLELHELTSEIIRQQREIAALRHPLTVGGDPLDENDHRTRHTRHGNHLYRHGPRHWHTFGMLCRHDCDNPLEKWANIGPLTICACGGSCG